MCEQKKWLLDTRTNALKSIITKYFLVLQRTVERYEVGGPSAPFFRGYDRELVSKTEDFVTETLGRLATVFLLTVSKCSAHSRPDKGSPLCFCCGVGVSHSRELLHDCDLFVPI